MTHTGIINADGTVTEKNGTIHTLPIRGTEDDGSVSVLIDAVYVGGNGSFRRQSVSKYVGMTARFLIQNGNAYNFAVLKNAPIEETDEQI